MNRIAQIFVIFFTLSLCIGCVEENISTDPSLRLSFSCDTLIFDTLFTGQPSATRRVMVYNRNKNALKINSVYLGKRSDSDFRFNFDGHIAGSDKLVEDVIIKGRDSLYLFVEVTPRKTEYTNPLALSTDSLVFTYNGYSDNIQLISAGRDAKVLHNYSLPADETFSAQEPYLVFGYIHIPEGLKLTLEEGTEIYMHGGANIIADGELHSSGTLDRPVIIRGDRFDRINDTQETPYAQMPNQWGGIYLQNPQCNYSFDHTMIHGMTTGILLLGAQRATPTLEMKNSVIHNSGAYGIYSQMSDISLTNSEISNCGESCMVMIGGAAKIAHVTIANYYRYAGRQNASVRLLNYGYSNGIKNRFPIESVTIENSIIFGSNTEELEIVTEDNGAEYNLVLSHTLIKGKKIENPMFYNCRWAMSQNVKNAKDTVFVNTSITDIEKTGYYNFRLDSLSHARNIGSQAVSNLYPTDLDGNSRTSDSAPDLGAYERIDGK